VRCFVLSLHRSGTVSTTKLLSELGLSVKHWAHTHDEVDLEARVAGREEDLDFVAEALGPVFDDYDAVADVPIPVLYRQLYARFPDAHFVLLHRDAFDWVRSVRKHVSKEAAERPLNAFERVQYWQYCPGQPRYLSELSDSELVGAYCRHTADVVEFFRERPEAKFGLFDLEDEAKGAAIASFLGRPRQIEFPHENAGKPRRKKRRRLWPRWVSGPEVRGSR